MPWFEFILSMCSAPAQLLPLPNTTAKMSLMNYLKTAIFPVRFCIEFRGSGGLLNKSAFGVCKC